MVNNNESLTLKYLLNAFKNTARLVEILHIHMRECIILLYVPTVLIEITDG